MKRRGPFGWRWGSNEEIKKKLIKKEKRDREKRMKGNC